MYIDIVIDYHQKSGNRQIGVCRFIALTRRFVIGGKIIHWLKSSNILMEGSDTIFE